MKLVVTICATKSYCYAMKSLARRVAANVASISLGDDARPSLVIVGDKSKETQQAVDYFGELLPAGWEVGLIAKDDLGEHKNYKERAQMVIAKMRSYAFAAARKLKADYCWSLDSDVLPPANALECSIQMLKFSGGYYGVSTCPYPNNGMIGGRGEPHNGICPNFYDDEKEIPAKLAKDLEKARAAAKQKPAVKIRQTRLAALEKKLKDLPPKGNVFKLNAERWRKRGWLDYAYPAIGRGSVVPIEWCGFGCTLMNRKALEHAHFEGYDGKGTEDLFICWRRWYPEGIKINCITHCLCDHVIHEKKKGGDAAKYTHIQSYHETEGEYAGHIRTRQTDWQGEF